MQLDVMSYNIRLGLDSSLDAIAHAIIDHGVPDVLALQEVGNHWNMGERVDQTDYLARRLNMNGTFCGALRDSDGGRYGIALLTRSEHEVITRRCLHKDQDEQRVCLIAKMKTKTPITLVTSHLSIKEAERREQAKALSSIMGTVSGPALLLGDLNARPESVEYSALMDTCSDAFNGFGSGPAETFSVKEPHRQIDYILLSKGHWTGESCRVLRDIKTSDHFPIWARISCRISRL
ncbi:MAG: endonuclease/exonuclease/phosphatase family protein [Myxococcota bacterium]|nr:endonuclease/exonuclease/phosphatase family protein [Myxococcota bacterium]